MGAPLPASRSRRVGSIGVTSHRRRRSTPGPAQERGRRQAWLEGPTENEKQRWIRRETGGGRWDGLPSTPVMETELLDAADRLLREADLAAKGSLVALARAPLAIWSYFDPVGPNVRRGALPTAAHGAASDSETNRADDRSRWTRLCKVRELASRHGKRRGYRDKWPTSDADGNRRTSRIENASRPRLIERRADGDDRQRVAKQAQLGPLARSSRHRARHAGPSHDRQR